MVTGYLQNGKEMTKPDNQFKNDFFFIILNIRSNAIKNLLELA